MAGNERSPERPGRLLELDALGGIAAILVVVFHFPRNMPQRPGSHPRVRESRRKTRRCTLSSSALSRAESALAQFGQPQRLRSCLLWHRLTYRTAERRDHRSCGAEKGETEERRVRCIAVLDPIRGGEAVLSG